MERLTKDDLNKVCYDPWEICGMDKHCTKGCHEEGGCTGGCHILKMYRKLADYEDKQEQGLLIEKTELDKYKLALFAVIKNSKVAPAGIAQGRSMEEINAMALNTLEEVMSMCDYETLGRYYSEAEEVLEKMKEVEK